MTYFGTGSDTLGLCDMMGGSGRAPDSGMRRESDVLVRSVGSKFQSLEFSHYCTGICGYRKLMRLIFVAMESNGMSSRLQAQRL